MKNFYLWIVAVMVCAGILPAAAQDAETSYIKFTVNIANAEGITCYRYGEQIPLHDGANLLEVPVYSNLSFSATLPWKITGVTDRYGTGVTGFYGAYWNLYVDPSVADMEYTISLINIDENRTSQFTLNVDDPSVVNAILGGYDQTLSLKAGPNTIKYDPAIETYLTLTHTDYMGWIYNVKKNGTDIATNDGSYYVELEEDCVIDVTAILPDEDRTVTFSYAEGAEGSIKVSANNQPLSDFDGKQLTVKVGTRLNIEGLNNYKYDSVKVNGQEVSFYGSYSFAVMKDCEVYVDAHPYGNASATLVVNLPEFITIKRNGIQLDLVAGANLIEFPENEANIMWNVSNEALINSVTVNDGEPLYSSTTYYTLNDGDVVVFDIAEKVYDNQFVFWIDNIESPACSSYISIDSQSDLSSLSMGNSNSEYSPKHDFESGYNLVAFYQSLNPFAIGWGYKYSGPAPEYIGQVYLNGERLVSPYGETSTYFPTDINDGDVVKLFMEAAPVECKVSFDIAEGVDVSVVKDVITSVENPADGFDCFNGTQVVVSGEGLEVKVNGTTVEGQKDDEGATSYTFVVADAETNVSVAKADGTGVEAVPAAAGAAVFNMQGVRVGSSLKGLAPGIYIVAGKKVVVTE